MVNDYRDMIGVRYPVESRYPTMTCAVCGSVGLWIDNNWVHPIFKGETRPRDHPPVFYVIEEELW